MFNLLAKASWLKENIGRLLLLLSSNLPRAGRRGEVNTKRRKPQHLCRRRADGIAAMTVAARMTMMLRKDVIDIGCPLTVDIMQTRQVRAQTIPHNMSMVIQLKPIALNDGAPAIRL